MKRSVLTMSVATLLVVALAMTAEAQPGGRGGRGGPQGGRGGQFGGRGGMMFGGGMMGRGGGGLLRLAQNEAVQKEIDALDDQVEAIDKAAEELRGERPDMSGFRDMSEEERTKFFEKMRKEAEERVAKGDKALAEILLPHQIERLEQINVQQMGLRALVDDDVAAKLSLGAKKAKIEEAMQKMGEEMMGLFRSGDRENMREKAQELREKAEKEIMGMLSADQKKAFEKMKGEPFEMPRPQFGGRGGRGGPGGDRGNRGGDRGGDRGRPQRPGGV